MLSIPMTLDSHFVEKELKPKGFNGMVYSLVLIVPVILKLIAKKTQKVLLKQTVAQMESTHARMKIMLINVKKISVEKAKMMHPDTENLIEAYREHSFSKLEKINFFNHRPLQKISTLLLEDFYQMEFITQQIAYSQSPANDEDKKLTEFASELALSSLSSWDELPAKGNS